MNSKVILGGEISQLTIVRVNMRSLKISIVVCVGPCCSWLCELSSLFSFGHKKSPQNLEWHARDPSISQLANCHIDMCGNKTKSKMCSLKGFCHISKEAFESIQALSHGKLA